MSESLGDKSEDQIIDEAIRDADARQFMDFWKQIADVLAKDIDEKILKEIDKLRADKLMLSGEKEKEKLDRVNQQLRNLMALQESIKKKIAKNPHWYARKITDYRIPI
jgi:Rad3-related DNA helicase